MPTPFGDASFIIGTVARIYFIQPSFDPLLGDLTYSDQIVGSGGVTSRFGSPVFGGSQIAHSYLYIGGAAGITISNRVPPPTGYKMIRKCPNCWDYTAREQHRLAERGTYCRPRTPWWVGHANAADPQHVFPKEAREIYRYGTVAIDFAATNALLFEFTIPQGYEGLLYALFHKFDGTGLVQGSGSLLWHLKVGNRYPKDMGNIAYELGEHASMFPMADYVNLSSNQHVAYRYSAAPGSENTLSPGNILAAVQGWIWPMGTDFGPPPGSDRLLPNPYAGAHASTMAKRRRR